MPLDSASRHHQLLTFTVPGLPEIALALALSEVIESVDFTSITPLPLAPTALLGLSNWRDRVVPVVDLTHLLCSVRTPPPVSGRWRCLVAQVLFETQIDCVAWPVMPEVRILNAPAQADAALLPQVINPALVRVCIALDAQPLVLLKLDHLCADWAGLGTAFR